jgi:hypothetical protein
MIPRFRIEGYCAAAGGALALLFNSTSAVWMIARAAGWERWITSVVLIWWVCPPEMFVFSESHPIAELVAAVLINASWYYFLGRTFRQGIEGRPGRILGTLILSLVPVVSFYLWGKFFS